MQSTQVLCGSFDDNAIQTGVSDTIIVKQKSGSFRSTPFLICFGPYHQTHNHIQINVIVNDKNIADVHFGLDSRGYVEPRYLTDKQIKKLNLNFGMNKVSYRLEGFTIESEIYLFADNDKLVVSDVDGTATKSDIMGNVNNFFNKEYLHDGYSQLLKKVHLNGYKVVWLTMRSLPLYSFSKNYLREHCGIDAPILMEPE